ncbi:MAG: metal ABC transporter permease [Actinomycetota bacterium]
MNVLSYGFMRHALLAVIVVGAVAPLIGIYLVQKRLALIGDGLGHVAFAGVAAGLLAGISPVGVALAFAVVGALGIERLRASRRAGGDLALSLFFYGGISAGVVLASAGGNFNANLLGYLFGSVLTTSHADLVVVGVLGLVIVGTVYLLAKELFATSFDEEAARVSGVPVGLVNGLLAVLVAVTVAVGMRVVGLLMVAALMVVPVASGRLLASSFKGTIFASMAVGVTSGIMGLFLAFYLDFAPGGTIVLVAIAAYGLVGLRDRLRRRREVFR